MVSAVVAGLIVEGVVEEALVVLKEVGVGVRVVVVKAWISGQC